MSPGLELRKRQVGPWSLNCYALVCPGTTQSLLVDPGADPEGLFSMLSGTTPVGILLTHSHSDHIGALSDMRARLQVPVMAHPGPHAAGCDPKADHWLNDGDSVQVGEHCLRVYYAPGHLGDAVCYGLEEDDRVLVGDVIFEGGPGRTSSAEDFQTTLVTLRDIVLRWSDEAHCYPGHGPSFRLGDRREAIRAFLRRNHGGFFGDATWDM
jgi:hydroxyacylglutathione hydrolase